MIKELLSMLQLQMSHISSYHPQGDAQPEFFNQTLLAMLSTLEALKKQNWSQYTRQLVHAYSIFG